MQRRRFNLAAAAAVVSLALCVATGWMWGWSGRVNDAVYYAGEWQLFEVHQAHGMVLWGWSEKCHKEVFGWAHGARRPLEREIYQHYWRSHGGFAVYRETMSMNCYGRNVWRVLVPHWFVIAGFAVFPARFVIGRARGARREWTRCCVACGYDLRATPQRCPECGTAAAVQA